MYYLILVISILVLFIGGAVLVYLGCVEYESNLVVMGSSAFFVALIVSLFNFSYDVYKPCKHEIAIDDEISEEYKVDVEYGNGTYTITIKE